MKDYYQILGLTNDASITEIRKAYRKLALEFHPDINKSTSANQQFLAVSEAYHVLKNANHRIKYKRDFESKINQKNKEANFQTNNKRAEQKAKHGSQMANKRFEKKIKRSSFFDGIAIVLDFVISIFSLF